MIMKNIILGHPLKKSNNFKILEIMRKFSILLFVACCTAVFSCNKNNVPEPEVNTGTEEKLMRIVAHTAKPESTKVELQEDYSLVWSEGDEILVRDWIQGATGVYHLVEGAGTTSGVFEGPWLPELNKNKVYYPASYGVRDEYPTNVKDWPTRQFFDGRKLSGAPMYVADHFVHPDVKEIYFQNEGGILSFNLKGTEKVGSITLKTESPKFDMFLDCGEGVQLTPEGIKFFLGVPPGTYTSARINVQTPKGNFSEFSAGELIVKKNVVSEAELTPVFNKFHVASMESFVSGVPELKTEDIPAFDWLDVDAVAINGVKYKVLPVASDSLYAGFSKVDDKAKPTAPYQVFWPNTIAGEGDGRYRMPSTFIYHPGRIESPMIATGSSTGFDFKNLCGALRLSITGNTLISKINVSTVAPSERLSGYCTIDDDLNIKFIKSESTKSVGMSFDRYYSDNEAPESISDGLYSLPYIDATDFYISLPPGVYSEGLIVKVYRGDGEFVQEVISGPLTIERNKVYSFAMDVPSKHTKFVTAMYKGQELTVRCTQLWSGGPYWAEYNIGMDVSRDYYGDTFSWGGQHEGDRTDYYHEPKNLGNTNNTAYYLWGENWRMPTKDEMHALAHKNRSGKCINYYSRTRPCLVVVGDGDYSYDKVFFTHQYPLDHYWTSTVAVEYPRNDAYYGSAFNNMIPDDESKWECRSVRPVLR